MSLKRAYGCDTRGNHASRQDIQQPCGFRPSPFPSNENNKRQKYSQTQITENSKSRKESWRPIQESSQIQYPSWESEPDVFLAREAPSTCLLLDPSSSANYSTLSSSFPGLGRSMDIPNSHVRNSQMGSYPWKETTPTTESQTLGSVSSRDERVDWEYDAFSSFDNYPYQQVSSSETEQDISHITGNSDTRDNLGTQDTSFELSGSSNTWNITEYTQTLANQPPRINIEQPDVNCKFEDNFRRLTTVLADQTIRQPSGLDH